MNALVTAAAANVEDEYTDLVPLIVELILYEESRPKGGFVFDYSTFCELYRIICELISHGMPVAVRVISESERLAMKTLVALDRPMRCSENLIGWNWIADSDEFKGVIFFRHGRRPCLDATDRCFRPFQSWCEQRLSLHESLITEFGVYAELADIGKVLSGILGCRMNACKDSSDLWSERLVGAPLRGIAAKALEHDKSQVWAEAEEISSLLNDHQGYLFLDPSVFEDPDADDVIGLLYGAGIFFATHGYTEEELRSARGLPFSGIFEDAEPADYKSIYPIYCWNFGDGCAGKGKKGRTADSAVRRVRKTKRRAGESDVVSVLPPVSWIRGREDATRASVVRFRTWPDGVSARKIFGKSPVHIVVMEEGATVHSFGRNAFDGLNVIGGARESIYEMLRIYSTTGRLDF